MQFAGTRRGADRGTATGSTLPYYFAEVGDEPVLARDDERALAGLFRARRAAVNRLLAGMPLAGATLSAQWRDRPSPASALRVLLPRSAQLRGPDTIRRFETSIRRIERRLRDRPPLTCRNAADAEAWDRFEALQRRDLLALELSPDVYREIEATLERSLRELETAAGASGRRRIRHRVGMPLPRFRRTMRTLGSLARSRDAARNELARHNLRLVVRFSKDFRNLGVDFADLIQEGNLGLLRAIDLFEPERGLKFSTYAVWWIRQALIRAIQKHSRTVRLPSHVNERLHQVGRATERLSARLGRHPTDDELASEIGTDSDHVAVLRTAAKVPLSLDHAASPDSAQSLHEYLPDPSVESPPARVDAVRDRRVIGELLTRLETRERTVIRRRYGFSGEDRATLDSIARELGLSRERVRQIEHRGLSKLRRWGLRTRLLEASSR